MASIEDIARDFTALLRAGEFQTAGERYWSPDVTSIEPADLPGGIRATASGIEAARIKRRAIFGGARIDEIGIDGPFITGDRFALFLDMVLIDRISGARRPFAEIALYTVRGDRIAEERYFHD